MAPPYLNGKNLLKNPPFPNARNPNRRLLFASACGTIRLGLWSEGKTSAFFKLLDLWLKKGMADQPGKKRNSSLFRSRKFIIFIAASLPLPQCQVPGCSLFFSRAGAKQGWVDGWLGNSVEPSGAGPGLRPPWGRY